MIAADWQLFFTVGTGLTALVGTVLGYFFAQYFIWVDMLREGFAG